ncbi:MAG: tetratricopeptide repeat protein [bacterium]
MASKNNSEERTGLTPEDYDRYFLLDWKIMGIIFLVIFSIVSGLFYWFQTQMRSNSNRKVQEARVMIDRADTVPRQLSPTTMEIEEIIAQVEADRDLLILRLHNDNKHKKIQRKLKNKFLQQAPFYELPSDWKQQLPPRLKKWEKKRKKARHRQIQAFLNLLPRIFERNRERLKRIDQLLKKIGPDERFSDALQRYRKNRERVLTLFSRIESRIDKLNRTKVMVKLPSGLFNDITRLTDPMNYLSFQLKRISALTSKPTSLVYARQSLLDALRIDPQNSEAFYQLGRVYEKWGMETLSSERYLWALKENKDFKRADQIIQKFKKEIQSSPDNPRNHYDLAYALYETGSRDRAFKQLLETLKLECGIPSMKGIHQRYKEGKKKEALHLLEGLLKNRGCTSKSMVQVLALKRVKYIIEGEPPYHKLAYF